MMKKIVMTVAMLVMPLVSHSSVDKKDQDLLVANLQAAFNGESNAHAKYLLFAEKADSEGYGNVGSLFRAAAKAEEIHAANHSVVLKKLGANPVATIKTPEIKSTAENLTGAIEGESYERDTMYPEFIQNAKKVGDRDALRTLNLARNAEIEHAKLYAEALKNLTSLKGSKKLDYFVCSVCGYTTTKMPDTKCPSSYSKLEKFVTIN